MRVAQEIRLSKKERTTLQRWSQGRTVSVRQRERAEMILLAADGMLNKEIAMRMGVKSHTVGCWRNRFAELDIAGIEVSLQFQGVTKKILGKLGGVS